MECYQGRDDNDIFNIDEASVSDSDDSSEKSPSIKKKRSSKTSKDQFQKLVLFMESHSDFTRRKPDDQLMLDWEKCCAELNSMGHAIHSPKEWRKVWSDYKGKKKVTTSASSTTADQLEKVFESTLPIDASSSHIVQHMDGSTQCSILPVEAVSSQDDKILAVEILKRLDRLVEIHSETGNYLKDLKEMMKSKFNM